MARISVQGLTSLLLLRADKLAKAGADLGLELAPNYHAALADIPLERRPVPCPHLQEHKRHRFKTTNFENALSGTWHGLDVRLFDFRTRTPDAEWPDLVYKYSCAVVSRPTGVRGASVDSGTLCRSYTTDFVDRPYFVRGLPGGLSPALHEWLPTLDGRWGFRIDDPWVFCYTTPWVKSPEKMTRLLEMLEGFIQRLGPPSASPADS
jgi:hypothetical protein